MVKRGYFQKRMEMTLKDIIAKKLPIDYNHQPHQLILMRYEFATDGTIYPPHLHGIPFVLKVTMMPNSIAKICNLSTNEFIDWVLERLEYYTMKVTGQKQIIIQTKTRFSELPSYAKRDTDADDYYFFAPRFGLLFQNHHCARDWILKEAIEHFPHGNSRFFLNIFPNDIYVKDSETGKNRIEVFLYGFTNPHAGSYERQLASFNTPIFNRNSHQLKRNHLQSSNDWMEWTSITNEDLELTPIQEDTAITVDFPITMIDSSSLELFVD